MRTIKFRGKRMYDRKWVYGYFGKDYSERCIISNYLNASNEAWEVIPETVDQFTGLLDKNGKEIYEGDIVQLDYITTIGKHRVGLSFEVKWCTQEGCWVGWDGFVGNALQQTRKMFVVKGNIYDNPELLKGGEK